MVRTGEKRNAYRILVKKGEVKRILGRIRHRWEDNSETDLKELRREVVEWFHLARYTDKWRSLVKKSHELSGSIKGGELLDKLKDHSLLKKGPFYKTKLITCLSFRV